METRDDIEETSQPVATPVKFTGVADTGGVSDMESEVFHTPRSDMKQMMMMTSTLVKTTASTTISKVNNSSNIPNTLSDLNQIVGDEEARYFSDLEEAQKKNSELRESLKAYDIETARLTSELETIQSWKEALEKENAIQKKQIEELKSHKEDSEFEQVEQLIQLKKEKEQLQQEKEAFEKGHDEQKEKWKALVISMKCEYDKIVESDKKNKEENESLKSKLDSLTMCKEVADAEYAESKEKWQQTVQSMQQEFDGLKSAIADQELQASKKLSVLKAEYDTLKQATEVGARQAAEDFGKQIKELTVERDNLKSELNSFQLCRSVSHEEHKQKKDIWEKRVGTLQAEYDSLMATTSNLKSEHEDLKMSKKELQSQHDKALHELEQAQKMQPMLDKLKTQFVELKSAYEEQTKDVERLKAGQEQADASLKEMKEAWKQESAECDKVKSMLATLQEDYDALLVEREAWEVVKTSYDGLMTDYNTLLSDYGAVKDSEVAYIQEKEQMAKEITNMLSVIDGLTSDMDDLKLEANSLVQDREEAETSVKNIQLEYDTLMSNFEAVDAAAKDAVVNHQKSKDILQKKIIKAEKALETKTEALNMALQKYLTEIENKEAAETKVFELEEELGKITNEKQELEADVAEMHQFIKTKDTVLDDLQSRFDHIRFSVESLICENPSALGTNLESDTYHAIQQILKTKQTELKNTQNEIIAMTKLAERKESEVLAARCENDALRAQFEEMDEQIQAEKEKLAEAQEEARMEVSALMETIEKKDAEIEASSVSCNSLRSSLKDMRKSKEEEKEELQKRISSLNHKVAQKITALNAAEATLDQMKEDLDAAHDMIEKLEKDSEDVQKSARFSRQLATKKENELDLIKKRCENLQSALEESEEIRRTEIAKREAAEKLRESEQAEAKLTLDHLQTMAEKKTAEVAELTDKYEQLKMQAENDPAKQELTETIEKKNAEIKEMEEQCESMKAAIEKAKEVYMAEAQKKSESDRKTAEEHEAALKKIAFLEDLVHNKESEVELTIARCGSIQTSLEKVEEKHRQQIELLKEEGKAELQKAQETINELKAVISSKQGDAQYEVVLENQHDDLSVYKARCATLQAALDKSQEMYQKIAAEQGENVHSGRHSKASERWNERDSTNATVRRPSPERSDAKKNRWLGLRKQGKECDTSTSETREERRARLGLPLKWSSPSPSHARVSALDITPRARPDYSVRSQPSSRYERFDGTTTSRLNKSEKTSEDPKELVLTQIPAHIRSNFLEIGFYKQRLQNLYLPVLCLSPFDVPSGPIRDDWLSKFDKDSKVLSLGVYFYGKTGGAAYGTIPWFGFVPYEKAVQRNLNQVPKQIQGKMDAGEALEDYEKELVEGIKLANEAANKDPELRTHPLYHMVEKRNSSNSTLSTHNVPKILTVPQCDEDHADHVSEMGF